MPDPTFTMTISLNVLNHLGLNLYSNIPAVLSEVVANSYDADAARVDVTIDPASGTVTIMDDGHGMTRDQVNQRFLNVGYERRKEEETRTSPSGRKVMGRKGIGKLSLFSIANEVEVYTARDGQKSALRMTVDAIRAALEVDDGSTYHPEALEEELVDFDNGTRIVLKSLKKGLSQAGRGLRTRLARRFSILGTGTGFQLFIGSDEVTIDDRDYFHKLQYIWAYGEDEVSNETVARCTKIEKAFLRGTVTISVEKVPVGSDDSEEAPNDAGPGDNPSPESAADESIPAAADVPVTFSVSGWIGTAKAASGLKDTETRDNLNKVSLVLRGKLAHEDLLEEFNENGVYASYLIGELRADFLDEDDQDDIATSSRQRIIEDDPRYLALMKWLRAEITQIGKEWLDLRNEAGRDTALDNPLIAEWFKTLKRDTKKRAVRLFGKINQLTIDDEREKAELFAQAVLGFETLRYRDNLDALDELDPKDLKQFVSLFKDISDIQATMYHQIVQQRLEIIDKLRANVAADVLERVLQEHLFDNLWLLDPGWERATDRSMESRVGTAFEDINKKLKKEERDSRMDIRYKRTGGINVIVELKRATVKTDTNKLMTQVDKYRNALRLYLRSTGGLDAIETVCVIGSELTDWMDAESKTESVRVLATKNIRVVQYEQLLADAQASYREYLDAQHDLGRIQELVMGLAAQVDDSQPETEQGQGMAA